MASLGPNFLAYTAYFDHYEERYNSGVSVIFQGANESFTETSWNEVGLGYSYRLQLSKDHFIQAGIQASFVTRDAYFGRVILVLSWILIEGVLICREADLLGKARFEM